MLSYTTSLQVWYAYTQYYFSLLTEVSVNMSVVFVSFSQNENAKREHENKRRKKNKLDIKL